MWFTRLRTHKQYEIKLVMLVSGYQRRYKKLIAEIDAIVYIPTTQPHPQIRDDMCINVATRLLLCTLQCPQLSGTNKVLDSTL